MHNENKEDFWRFATLSNTSQHLRMWNWATSNSVPYFLLTVSSAIGYELANELNFVIVLEAEFLF